MKHFISIQDHSPEELEGLLATAIDLKNRWRKGIPDPLLQGQILSMYFEKPSLRTRVSLETAMISLGGAAICLDPGGRSLGARESIKDQALVMGRYVNAVSIRCFAHETVASFAEWSPVPVINALSDFSHPTQAMADILTMREHLGDTRGKTVTFVGDGNNVARSLAEACAKLGMRFVCSSPSGYELSGSFIAELSRLVPAARTEMISDPDAAVREAAVVYTDVWASMGQEAEQAERRERFMPYQINARLLAKAPAGALVMHCLPAHRGEEISDEVIDGPRSIVYDQSENRMHLNRALLVELLVE